MKRNRTPRRWLDRLLVTGAVSLGFVLPSAPSFAGDLISLAEIDMVRARAAAGDAAVVAQRGAILSDARRSWRWGDVSGRFITSLDDTIKRCHPKRARNSEKYLKEGAPDAYAKVLGYLLSDQPDPAWAIEARARVMALAETSHFGGLAGRNFSGQNQCVLELSISLPVWIETARLLEATPFWSAEDRARFASWLASEAFPRVAWASRSRRNNWGVAGSGAASAIASYVEGLVPSLTEIDPEARTLTPAAARAEHDAMQLERIRRKWRGDAKCALLGIQEHGGVPEELRRGSTGCNGRYLLDDDSSHAYQTMYVELLVLHAEAQRRRGEETLFKALLASGQPAILQAILFVIDNPTPGGRSWPWRSWVGPLAVAYRYYGDPRLASALKASDSPTSRGGRTLPYARLVPLGPLGPLAPRIIAIEEM